MLDKNSINNRLSNPIILTLFLFLIVFALVYTRAVFPERHMEQLEYFFKACIIVTCAYLLANTVQKVKWYIQAYIVGAFYLSFYAYQIGRNSGARVHGIGVLDNNDSNSVAASLIPAAILALHFLFHEKHLLKRLYYAAACLFIANALVLINSRGAMLGLVLGGGYYLFKIYGSGKVIKYARTQALGLVFVAIIGGIYVADDSAIDRFSSIFEQSSTNVEVESGATRTHFWKAAIDMSKDYPLGLGYRGFNAYSDFYIPKEVNTGRKRSRSVHSSWFEALSEVGYIGLGTLLILVFLSIKLSNAVKRYFESVADSSSYLMIVAIQGGLVANYIAMTFISRMRSETFLWLLLFVAALYDVTKRLQDEKKSESSNPKI